MEPEAARCPACVGAPPAPIRTLLALLAARLDDLTVHEADELFVYFAERAEPKSGLRAQLALLIDALTDREAEELTAALWSGAEF